jgi:hypothetical protein
MTTKNVGCGCERHSNYAFGSGFGPVQNPFNITPGPMNQEPDYRSGSGQSPNLNPTIGPVRSKFGPNHGSEPDHGIATPYTTCHRTHDGVVETQNAVGRYVKFSSLDPADHLLTSSCDPCNTPNELCSTPKACRSLHATFPERFAPRAHIARW